MTRLSKKKKEIPIAVSMYEPCVVDIFKIIINFHLDHNFCSQPDTQVTQKIGEFYV